MQKMQAQSQGNQNLEVTKALTKPLKDGEKAPNIQAAVGFNQLSHRLSDPLGSNTVQPVNSGVAVPHNTAQPL
jgi:hypothetical protein